MGFLLLLVILGSYVGCGFVKSYTESKCKGEEFQTDWNEVLLWPKVFMAKNEPEAEK